jgi:hypothetical protein
MSSEAQRQFAMAVAEDGPFAKDPLAPTTVFTREETAPANTPIYDNLQAELGVEVEEENDGDIPGTGEDSETDFDGSEQDDSDDEDESWSEDEDEDDDEDDDDEDEDDDEPVIEQV